MYALMIWTIVAAAGDRFSVSAPDWRPLAVLESKQLCDAAAQELGIQTRYRCIKVK